MISFIEFGLLFMKKHNRGYFVAENRRKKAIKIVKIIDEEFHLAGDEFKNKKVLDIGTGQGGIAQCLSEAGNSVISVDVERQFSEENEIGFEFVQVNNEILPFENNYFDVVVSNHTAEHLTDRDLHLSEINRVLKNGGICYFALPNRFFPYEPHTKTLFIHWLPNKLFWKTLEITGKYQENLYLFSHKKAISDFKKHNFSFKEYTVEVMNNPEKYGVFEKHYRIAEIMKLKFPRFIQFLSPTNIFVLHKK